MHHLKYLSLTAILCLSILKSANAAVTYQGGDILESVEVQAVYLGSGWTDLADQRTKIDTFLAYIVDSPYMDMLTNAGYGVGRGSAQAGIVDPVTLDKTAGITEAQIRAEIQVLISSGKLKPLGADNLVVVYVEPGVAIKYGSASAIGSHGAFKAVDGTAVHYATVQYSASFNQITWVTTQELAEACVNPNVGLSTLGWVDMAKAKEIGDLADGKYSTLNGYLVQNVANKAGTIISPTTAAPVLAAPTTFTATVLSSTSVQLAWSATNATLGYRVYQVNGTTRTLLGEVNGLTLSYNAKGLTAGSKPTFQVDAYNRTATVSSKAVTATLPASNALYSPDVAVSFTGPTTALLSWNQVVPAAGYRIYYLNGTTKTLLSSTGPTARSFSMQGLKAGATYKFAVEAYALNSNAVASSGWISVVVPVNVILK